MSWMEQSAQIGLDTVRGVQTLDPALLHPQSVPGLPGPHGSGVPIVAWAVLAAALVLAGFVLGTLAQRRSGHAADDVLKPRFPRDWPPRRTIFTTDAADARKAGYLRIAPTQALRTGHVPLGRTYPRWSVFPDRFPFQGLRRWVRYWSSQPIFIPYRKRFEHLLIVGGTGKGKTSAFALPALAYGALEPTTAYFAVDVKAPELARTLAVLYREAGKPIYPFAPWSIEETLACEPVWRANEERRNLLAEVIANYNVDATPPSETGNSTFFRDKSAGLLRAVLELAQYWPRRYCNLPCIQQLVSSSGGAIAEAFARAPAFLPTRNECLAAAELLVAIDAAPLESGERATELTNALSVIDRAGHVTARLVRRMREHEADFRRSRPSAERIADARREFRVELAQECARREQALKNLLISQAEILQGADETRSGVVSTLANKLVWFRESHIARAFSRDELDPAVLTRRPCLLLVGAPMAKKKIGSLFVSSLISNIALNSIYQRGMALTGGDRSVSDHGIFPLLDEFVQLRIHEAPDHLALFRSFHAGLTITVQERSMLRHMYGDLAIAMEANLSHRVLLQGAHEETAEYYATKSIGDAHMVRRSRSGAPGEKQSITESVERVPRMTTAEVKAMEINGRRQDGIALNVGAAAPPFPFMLAAVDQDPTLRKLLKLRRVILRKGEDGRVSWRFWEWKERWLPPEHAPPILRRQAQRTATERSVGIADPVHDRLRDPHRQLVDFLLFDARRAPVFDELTAPQLVLSDIGVIDADPTRPTPPKSADAGVAVSSPRTTGSATSTTAGGTAADTHLPGSAARSSSPVLDADVVPVYEADFRALLTLDYEPADSVPALPEIGGALGARARAVQSVEPDAARHYLAYDAELALGTRLPQPNGSTMTYVTAEAYHVALLGQRMDANQVFIQAVLPGRVPTSQLSSVDDAVAEAYWQTYLGCLMPRRVVRALTRATQEPGGARVLALLEQARQEMYAAVRIADAAVVHADLRVQLLVAGATNALTERSITIGEVLADYLLLQRGVADDVRHAELKKRPGETRAAWLDRFDRDDEMQYFSMLSLIHQPQRVVERIPQRYRADVIAFASTRAITTESRVFSLDVDDSTDSDPVEGSAERMFASHR